MSNNYKEILNRQKEYFRTGETKNVAFRLAQLERMQDWIGKNEEAIMEALHKDLHKAPFEAYATEIGIVKEEIRYTLKHLRGWARPKRVPTPITQFPSRSFIYSEPYGTVLIMSPWNYPFQLTIAPLVGALSAGNCAVVKPSAYSSATSALIARMIKELFPQKYVTVIEGGRKENEALLSEKFDYIFFTGSVSVGKLVMEKAAKHLTPVSLELGGKSPCIVDHTAKLSLAAKRIVFGKFLNCGQTCVAPDYVLVERRVKDTFLKYLIYWTKKMYGENAFANPSYGRIVNRKHFDRISGLIEENKVVYGGRTKEETLQIEPTILFPVSEKDAVMQEEIFGPVLPILVVENMDEAQRFVQNREKPLACYIFTSSRKTRRKFVRYTSFGGGCVNDTVMHLTTPELPFGGVGNSGMGAYHGKRSFETFSHQKSILDKSQIVDIPVRYQPYRMWKKAVIRLIGTK